MDTDETQIEQESVIQLSQKDARKVLALLDNPLKPKKRLKDAVQKFKATRGVVRDDCTYGPFEP